jgi:UDP-2-acetamido-3-amino-2,3-dideoxy-glucuronate N-acetyltransferase
LSYFAHSTAVIDQGAIIGEGTKTWHFCHIMSQAVIGKFCSLGQNVFVANRVVLGNNVKVQNNVSMYEGVICEDDVFLGPSMVFTNVINPRSAVSRKDQYRFTYVERGASIGANATIVCGNRIGAFALIGAGAVVTKNVLPYALVVGNPARQGSLGDTRTKAGLIKLHTTILFTKLPPPNLRKHSQCRIYTQVWTL